MGVLWCREKYGNEAEFDTHADGSKYKKIYRLRVEDAQADRELTIINDPIVQAKIKLLQPWEAGSDIDPSSFAMRFRLRQDEDHPELYDLEVEFEPPTIQDEAGGNPSGNPLADPPEVEWGYTTLKQGLWEIYKHPLESPRDLKDWDEAEFSVRIGALSSAKEPFDPQPDLDEHILTLTVTRNEPNYNALLSILYAGVTNSDNFPPYGVPAGKALMLPWRATRQFRNGVFYWKVKYEVHFRKKGWDLRLVDHGSYYWDASALPAGELDYRLGAKKIRFRDEFGASTTGLLNGRGGKLAVGSDPIIMTINEKAKAPFGPLNL